MLLTDVVNSNVASLFQDEASEHGATPEVPVGDADTAERVPRAAEEEQQHAEQLHDTPVTDDGDQLLPSENLQDKSEDLRETDEGMKEGDKFDDLDDEPVEERQPEGERPKLDDQVVEEREVMEPEGDTIELLDDQVVEEKAPERIVHNDIISENRIGDTFDDLDADTSTKDEAVYQEKVGDSFEDLDVDKPDQVHTEEELEQQRGDGVTDDESTSQDDVIQDAAKGEPDPEIQEEVVELADFQDELREDEEHETQEQGDDVLLEEPIQKRDDVIEAVDIQDGPAQAELFEEDDIQDDLPNDDDKPAEKEETAGDDFMFEEKRERKEQDTVKDEESDEGYETAPESEVLEETPTEKVEEEEEEKEVKIEPIELEIHHKDVVTETEDDYREDLMEAVQEPNINIQVEVHNVEEIPPEVKINDEPEVMEPEREEKDTHEEPKQIEDDFSEFDKEIEEEREDFRHVQDETFREKEEESKNEKDEVVVEEEESKPEEKEIHGDAPNQDQSEVRKEDQVDAERQENNEDAADETKDEEISKIEEPELPSENLDQKEAENEDNSKERAEGKTLRVFRLVCDVHSFGAYLASM